MSDADVLAYIGTLPEPRRSQVLRLHGLIREETPDIDAKIWEHSDKLIG